MTQLEAIDTRSITLSDGEWCEAIVSNIGKNAEVNGIQLPGYPDETTQSVTTFLGASESMMRGAFQLYKHVKLACEQHSRPINTDTRVLDFGCGWGRILRFFLKDASLSNLYGVELLDELTQACRQTFDSENFHTIKNDGSIPHPDSSFDVVFANSVFSHLDEELNLHWVKEIHRVLKDDGVAVLTIIDQKKYTNMLTTNKDWMVSLGANSSETRQSLSEGELVWKNTNRKNELEGYGLAFVPVSWVLKNWSHLFQLQEARDNYSQCVLVLKKQAAKIYLS